MPMGSSRLRFSSCSRKRQAGMGSENIPTDVATLNVLIDSQSLFDRKAPGLLLSGEDRATDDVLRALLSEANRELADLLRDVRAESAGTGPGDARNQHANELLMRAVRCAAKQYRLQVELGNLALTDELTGLYNRRGFMTLAERQLKVGRRSGREMMLFVMDVDGLKQINDSFGHFEGDRALKVTAQALVETFRDSDVVARLGGDEFAVLAVEATGHSEATIRARLCEYLDSIGGQDLCCSISLSLGAARFDPCSGTSLRALMDLADHAMYAVKQGQSRPSTALESSLRTQ